MSKVTIQNVRAAAATLAKAEAATGSSNAARTAATQTLFTTVGRYFATDKAATVDVVLPAIYADWAGFKATVQKSRKTEWNTVRELAHRDANLIDGIGAMVVSIGREFKPTMLKALTFAKNNAGADVPAIKAVLEAKAVKSTSNEGDIFEGFMAAGADLFQRFPACFKAVQPQLAAMQTYYNSERGLGRLRTSKELAKAKQPEAAVDFGAAK